MKKLVLLFISIFSTIAIGKVNIIQGPFIINENGSIFFTQKDKLSPIFFIQQKNGKNIIVDKYFYGIHFPYGKNYQIMDGPPKLESVFFITIQKTKNIVVLISADEQNPHTTYYRPMVYIYQNNSITPNELINRDKKLNDYTGCFSDALSVKIYLNKKYNNINIKKSDISWWQDCGFDDN